ncbi:MAG: hypothetical protein ABIS67_03555, partial [Candidatus Eisenbacteria bacterium]
MKRFMPVLALAALCAASAPAHGYFELTSAGARLVALGPSAMGVVDDVSAYHWNPAALASLSGPELLLDSSKPYGVDNLAENAIAAGMKAWGTGWALAWHRTAVADVYAEDQFCAAAGRTLVRTEGGSQLDAGTTFIFGRAAFQPFAVPGAGTADYGAVSKGSFDVGARWRTPWKMDVSWLARDILQPRYEFAYGSGGERLSMHHEIAAAFRWNRESTLNAGWAQGARGRATISAGLEILFFDVFAIRSGLSNLASTYQATTSPNELQFSGGFGVFHRGYFIDAAAGTHHDLGASYRVSFRFRPRGP